MSVFHDAIEIEDTDTYTYYFRCPCGDKFAITEIIFFNRVPPPEATSNAVFCQK
uniref:DPH-type MB domain-containing protein n=1 Tax=Mola mola TaxID=94237 RepID=A0A3Q3X2I5_MOLML